MHISKFMDFIPQNVAPKTAKRIAVYNSKDEKVGQFELQNLKFPKVGQKLYSFGAISDIHLQYNTALEDFQRALLFLHNEENTEFTCLCGDLTDNGEISDYEQYKSVVGNYPVYEILGNHDYYTLGNNAVEGIVEEYTGESLYYSFEKNDDVFIMVGIRDEYELFTDGELQWLYETLEANRNKRCFVFQHIFPSTSTNPSCGNAYGIYNNLCWSHPTQTKVFENMMKHYKNVLFFHGHSHLEFALQSKDCQYANYDESNGYRSIHIPSLSILRSGDSSGNDSRYDIASGSQGYVVDVYRTGIHLKGRDFVGEKYLPIASYWIDTTLVEIEANTFVDSTGTISTQSTI